MSDTMRQRADIEAAVEGQTTCDLLRRNADEHGQRPALSWRTESSEWHTLTWAEYRAEVGAAALALADLGVGRGEVVAIMGTTRPEHVVADQAAVHAGATPTTFYRTLAPEQIAYVADNCGARVAVLENRDYMKKWTEIRGRLDALETIVLMEHAGEFSEFEGVMSWDDLLARGRELAAEHPNRFEEMAQAVEPDDRACLIYTSGTTGPPKGVELTHHNVLFEVESLQRVIGLPDFPSNVSYLPLAHIAERILSLYLPQRLTGHTYFCPDPAEIRDYLLQARPSSFFGVPRVWEKFRAAITAELEAEESDAKRRLGRHAIKVGTAVTRLEQDDQRPSLVLRAEHKALDALVLSKIRDAVGLDRCEFSACAAAPLPVDVAEFFAAIGLPLLEVYGMTETTGVATANTPDGLRIGTVGPAIPGVEVDLADDGEVLVRGPNNTPGYLGLPDRTAELIDEDGWIHTGDLGELDDDGYLRIVDRKKELIITAGGKNLSPANIEAHLKEHPLVGQALAYGDGRPYVVALIVLDGDVAPEWAHSHGIDVDEVTALAEHPEVRAEIDGAVEQANDKLARVEQVKRYRLLPTEWTPESEELTPTMKLKRRVIHDKYAEEIDALYED